MWTAGFPEQGAADVDVTHVVVKVKPGAEKASPSFGLGAVRPC